MGELDDAIPMEGAAIRDKSYLYYGPPGSGKTTTALHRDGKKILIDVDNKATEMEHVTSEVRKTVTIWSLPDTVPGGQIDVVAKSSKIPVDPRGFRKIVNVINELLALARSAQRDSTPFPYEVAILDTWTTVADHAFDKVRYDQGRSKLTWEDWGLLHANQIAVLKGFLQLPCERIICAHDVHRTIRDPETQEVREEYIRPAVPGQLSETFGKYFTEVWYFHGRERNGDYRIQTVKDRLLMARTASNLPAEVIISQQTKQLVLPVKK